jgi:RimJ/RimL family protein N-acetyltransferase
MSKFLSGQLINLRVFTKSDIAVWSTWFNDSGVTERMNKGAFPNTESLQEEIFNALSRSKADVQLAIVLKENDALIGIVGIHKIDWIHRRGDISIVIGESEHRGKGIATEAVSLIVEHGFTKLNLHKLTAGVWSSNLSSRRCFEKNRFVLEGKLKEQFWYKDSYVDEYRLGLLRRVWKKSRERA